MNPTKVIKLDRYTNEAFTFEPTIYNASGGPMTDADVDNVIYCKGKDGIYYKRVVPVSVNVNWWGAKGNGVDDDSVPIQKCFDAILGLNVREVVFDPSCTYVINNIILNNNDLVLNINNSTIKNTSSGVDLHNINILGNNVTIRGGFFDFTGVVDNMPITVGFYNTETDYAIVNNFTFENNTVKSNTENKSALYLRGHSYNAVVQNSSFVNIFGADNSTLSRQIAIYIDIGTPVTTNGEQLNIKIFSNYFEGWNKGPDNFSTGYLTGLFIDNNTFQDCGVSIRPYHSYGSVITNNRFFGSIQSIYIWRSFSCNNNYFKKCGTEVSPAVIVESLLGNFSNNKIEDSVGDSLLLDGDGAGGGVIGNIIVNSGGNGLVINSLFYYGGQNVGLSIMSNKIYGTQKHGVLFTGGSARSIKLVGNIISGVGRLEALLYAGIAIVGTVPGDVFEQIEVFSNSIYGNDSLYGIQNSKIAYGILLDEQLSNSAFGVIAKMNTIYAPSAVKSYLNSAIVKIFTNNSVSGTIDLVIGSKTNVSFNNKIGNKFTGVNTLNARVPGHTVGDSIGAVNRIENTGVAIFNPIFNSSGLELVSGFLSGAGRYTPLLKFGYGVDDGSTNSLNFAAFIGGFATDDGSQPINSTGGQIRMFTSRTKTDGTDAAPKLSYLFSEEGFIQTFDQDSGGLKGTMNVVTDTTIVAPLSNEELDILHPPIKNPIGTIIIAPNIVNPSTSSTGGTIWKLDSGSPSTWKISYF